MKTFTNTLLLFALGFLLSSNAFSVPKLSSFPGASATIYLDFDGEMVSGTAWNNGHTINCAASGMTDAQITEVFNRVSEDYRPFNINITTDLDVYLAAPLNTRMRVIITPTSNWQPGVGGISYVGSFTWGDDTPCFVFSDRLGPNSPKYVGECCSHESGHSLGLSHQSAYDASCNLVSVYNTGAGAGETGWAPVMGNSYYKNMTGWDDGPTPYGCAILQDNLTIITTQNGFTYRTDDYSDVLTENPYSLGNASFSIDGLISTTTDKDAFRYDISQGGGLHMEITPFRLNTGNAGANIDLKLEMYDENKALIRTFDPTASLNIVIDTTLNAGTYYFIVTGTGNGNVSDYGSLGSYTLVGLKAALPIHDISLLGNTDKNKHNFSWNIIADEPVKSQTLEYSTNGVNFSPLLSLSGNARSFSYVPYKEGIIYYRLRATSVIDQTAYSNIIAMRSLGSVRRLFTVSTLVQHEITINATEGFQYQLSDANGRLITRGKGTMGINKVNIANQSGGMYILQIFNNNERQTERIIKQ